jgi:hypothetical protein
MNRPQAGGCNAREPLITVAESGADEASDARDVAAEADKARVE